MTPEADYALRERLLEGFTTRSRNDGRQDRRGRTVDWFGSPDGDVTAQLVVGRTGHARLNFRDPIDPMPPGLGFVLDGADQDWRGGGVLVTTENIEGARLL